MQTLEYRKDVFPEQPPAGPFFANLGGFLLGLILGFPKIQPGPDTPQAWSKGTVILPAGWRSIEIENRSEHSITAASVTRRENNRPIMAFLPPGWLDPAHNRNAVGLVGVDRKWRADD
jgi:hypothetical protein